MPNTVFNCKPSKRHAGFLFAMAGFAAVSVLALPWWVFAKLLIIIAIAIYTVNAHQRVVNLRSKDAILALKRLHGGIWLITLPEREVKGRLLKTTAVTRVISVLQFRVSGQPGLLTCVLFPDSLPDDHYRRFLASF